jgi:hypothetical protein
MQTVHLEAWEISVLDRPANGNGGYQSLLRRLQRRIDRSTGHLDLTPADLQRIPRYAFDYGNGGWEDRLVSIFSRTLGLHLGRVPARTLSGTRLWR